MRTEMSANQTDRRRTLRTKIQSERYTWFKACVAFKSSCQISYVIEANDRQQRERKREWWRVINNIFNSSRLRSRNNSIAHRVLQCSIIKWNNREARSRTREAENRHTSCERNRSSRRETVNNNERQTVRNRQWTSDYTLQPGTSKNFVTNSSVPTSTLQPTDLQLAKQRLDVHVRTTKDAGTTLLIHKDVRNPSTQTLFLSNTSCAKMIHATFKLCPTCPTSPRSEGFPRQQWRKGLANPKLSARRNRL